MASDVHRPALPAAAGFEVATPSRHVTHILPFLGQGGAELVLARLVALSERVGFRSTVICLTERGAYADEVEAAGVTVLPLHLPKGAGCLPPLTAALRRLAPDVVQTWMYRANLFGGLAARQLRLPVVWNLRRTEPYGSGARHTTKALAWCGARLSGRVPERIICCAEAARLRHAAVGYDERGMVVIPNGYDTNLFQPDPAARQAVRAELGLGEEHELLGLVGRFNPDKDHYMFVQAAACLAQTRPLARFVMCGEYVDHDNAELTAWIRKAALGDRLQLLGRRTDVHRINAALDVACLTSRQEGFPNVVAEGMACGVPCVVTDVGDAAAIVGPTGRVAPPRDAARFAALCGELLDLGRDSLRELGAQARERIVTRYSLTAMVAAYSDVWSSLATQPRSTK